MKMVTKKKSPMQKVLKTLKMCKQVTLGRAWTEQSRTVTAL